MVSVELNGVTPTAPISPSRPFWHTPLFATLIGAILGTIGTFTTFRVAQANLNGASTARMEAIAAKVDDSSARLADHLHNAVSRDEYLQLVNAMHDQQTRYVSKDEFQQFLAQISDMKLDIRDIKESLRSRRER